MAQKSLRVRSRQVRLDPSEGGFDLVANQSSGGDDTNSDKGCDQTVLDSRGARLVIHKTLKQIL